MAVEAIILAGGLGSRLRSVVADVPKPLAPINGVPFLDILLARLNRYDFLRKVVLAVGYQAQMVISRYDGMRHDYNFAIDFSVETELLGTGGGIKQASKMTTAETILVFNGDTFVGVDLRKLIREHQRHGAPLTAVVKKVRDARRYGTVILNDQGLLVAFREKVAQPSEGNELINAGLYAMNRRVLGLLKEGKSSLETDVLPIIAQSGHIRGYVTNGRFIDIGIPETYLSAGDYLHGVLTNEGGRS